MGTYDTFVPMFARIEPQPLPREPLGAHGSPSRGSAFSSTPESQVNLGSPSRGCALTSTPESQVNLGSPSRGSAFSSNAEEVELGSPSRGSAFSSTPEEVEHGFPSRGSAFSRQSGRWTRMDGVKVVMDMGLWDSIYNNDIVGRLFAHVGFLLLRVLDPRRVYKCAII
jgi:hypothetical protein